jgi:hypothetical protein
MKNHPENEDVTLTIPARHSLERPECRFCGFQKLPRIIARQAASQIVIGLMSGLLQLNEGTRHLPQRRGRRAFKKLTEVLGRRFLVPCNDSLAHLFMLPWSQARATRPRRASLLAPETTSRAAASTNRWKSA